MNVTDTATTGEGGADDFSVSGAQALLVNCAMFFACCVLLL